MGKIKNNSNYVGSANNFFNYDPIESLKEGICKYPQYAASWCDNLGTIYAQQKKYSDAIDSFTKAIKKASTAYFLAYLHRAQAYEQQGEWANAKEDLQQAINLYDEKDPQYKKIEEKLQELEKKIAEKNCKL